MKTYKYKGYTLVKEAENLIKVTKDDLYLKTLTDIKGAKYFVDKTVKRITQLTKKIGWKCPKECTLTYIKAEVVRDSFGEMVFDVLDKKLKMGKDFELDSFGTPQATKLYCPHCGSSVTWSKGIQSVDFITKKD